MKTKKLLVQLEYDPARTRWLYRDEELDRFIESMMHSVAACHTTGAVPAITVTAEEQPEPNPQ